MLNVALSLSAPLVAEGTALGQDDLLPVRQARDPRGQTGLLGGNTRLVPIVWINTRRCSGLPCYKLTNTCRLLDAEVNIYQGHNDNK